MNLFERIHAFVTPRETRIPSTPRRREILHGEAEEEEFSYQTTRCLSSYYSIFVARLAIMVMLAILIGMLTMLTWHFTRVYTTNSINSLAYGLRYELLQRPILRMWNILNSTVEITMAQVKLSEYVIGRYEKPVAQTQQVELYQEMRDITWALFASRKALNAITISYRNGFVQAFHRDHRSNNTFYIYSDPVNSSINQNHERNTSHGPLTTSKDDNASAIWYREPLNPVTGEKMGDRRQIPPDDLINIAGLPEVRDGAASWHVTVSKFTDSPLLSAALPVRDPSGGSIVAAVGVTTALKSVGQLMRELVEIHSGYMYLTSREGYLLATSTDASLLRSSTTGPKLMMANDSKDHMIRSGAEWLQEAYSNNFPISHEVHVENVMLGRQKYYIDSFFLNLKRLPLVGVIIIPRKYIMGKVDQIGFTTLVILISASICILAIGCVCILILTSGVSKAMKLRAELISQFDARRRAEASNNYKSQFLANMSHELRTPMAAVIGLLDILIYDDCLTKEQFATVTQIRKCSTALLRLLNNILDLSKVESGKLVLEEAEFNLERELEGLVDMFSVQCMNHDVEIILDLSDDIPKVVRGDSARVIQIFTNLISNSIKFTSAGHIILRGRCGSSNTSGKPEWSNDQKAPKCALKSKSKQHESSEKRDSKNNNRITIWFEVEDTGCGIDASKWESVFESFEQADPSTTRTHGGTGLGLCIVRNLVNKIGGEIKVAKKDGPGTLMQLYLVFEMPEDGAGKNSQLEFGKNSIKVLLAINGSKGRYITSQWLQENGVITWEASEWNGLTHILQQVFQGNVNAETDFVGCSTSEQQRLNRTTVVPKKIDAQNRGTSNIVIVVDTRLLDQSTNIWNEQLIYLNRYRGKAKFAWLLSHDTSNAIKVDLRRKGHFLMVNKPLYKTKMIQILEAVTKEKNFEHQNRSFENSTMLEDFHECHDIDPIHFDTVSSDDSDISEKESSDSRTTAFVVGENARERILASHHSHCRASNSKKESARTVSQRNALQNPNILPAAENLPKLSKDFVDPDKSGNKYKHMDWSRRNWHDNIMKQNKTSTMVEKLQELEPQLAVSSLVKNINVFGEFNQLHDEDEKMLEKDYRCHGEFMYDVVDSKKLVENRNAAVPADQMKRQLSNQKVTELACRSFEPSEYQVTKNSPYNKDCVASSKTIPCQNPLGGLFILLAEDNTILQKVATVMLEKVGATVVAVGDGMKAVDAIKCMFHAEESRKKSSTQKDGEAKSLNQFQDNPPFDLILMDCQMPKLDGYEATKAIRKLEAGTGSHIPIVAVTAHAMSSDEAKCLEVGMDAYLTKPIDCKLMVSTILSLTKGSDRHF